MIDRTHGARESPGYPGQSAQSSGLCPPAWLLLKTLYSNFTQTPVLHMLHCVQGKDGRRLVTPHLIEASSCLETGLLAYLLDAHQEKTRSDTRGAAVTRQILRATPQAGPCQGHCAAYQRDQGTPRGKDQTLLNHLGKLVNILMRFPLKTGYWQTLVSSPKDNLRTQVCI